MRRIGRVEQVGVQHRVVLDTAQRDSLGSESVNGCLVIVNGFGNVIAFEGRFHSCSRFVDSREMVNAVPEAAEMATVCGGKPSTGAAVSGNMLS